MLIITDKDIKYYLKRHLDETLTLQAILDSNEGTLDTSSGMQMAALGRQNVVVDQLKKAIHAYYASDEEIPF